MRVLFLSEPSLFGEAVEELLRQEQGLEIVGRAADPHEAIRLIKEVRPDVVVFTDGEEATELEAELLRLVREGFPMRIVEVHLATNSICLYLGERQQIGEVKDLVDTVRHLCEGKARDTRVPLLRGTGQPAI